VSYSLIVLSAVEKQILRLNSPEYEAVRDRISDLRENRAPRDVANCMMLRVGEFAWGAIASCTKSTTPERSSRFWKSHTGKISTD